MAATATAVSEYFATDAAVAAGTDAMATAAVATPVVSATAVGTELGALGAAELPAAAAVAGGGAATTGGMLGNTLLNSAVTAAGSAAIGSLLAPEKGIKAAAPVVAPVTEMPDPLAQEQARKKSLIEQISRRGRASTILTQDAAGDKLGG